MTRSHWAGLTASLAAALALAACASESKPDAGALLDDIVAAGAPGALASVREDGETRVEARGFADLDDAIEMRADARFRIGSVTKTFVATLVLLLAEDGELRLDDTVERWLPGLLSNGRRVTVRHLLAHTSGLFDFEEDERVLSSPERGWTPEELVAIALEHPAEHAPPGSGYAYSSTNYVVLGLIAERAGGAALGQQLQSRIFGPLGLRDTSFGSGVVFGPHIHGHRPPSHQGVVTGPPADVSDEPAWWTGAAGAIVSTADDVHRFFAALLRGEILGPQLQRELETLVPAGRLAYVLGIATFPTPCGDAWGHTGNVKGTVVVAWNTKDASRQLVLVVNSYPHSVELEAAVVRAQDALFCG